jgi:hypothetical protein
VPLGVIPPQDGQAGLPSSHIMADAFRSGGVGPGGVSNPILVSGSGPPPFTRPVTTSLPTAAPSEPAPPGRGVDSEPDPGGPPLLDAPSAATVTALLREMGELHGQMLTQFEQSLGLMVRLFACLGPDQLPAMQQELARIQELNGELGRLQAELARRAAQTAPPSPPVPPAAPADTSTDSTALHDWVADRIGTLQKERQARWQSLVGLFSAAEGRRK